MKKILLFLICFSFSFVINAQDPFWKITHWGWGTQIMEKNDTIITIGSGITDDMKLGFQLNKYGKDGLLLSEWWFKHDSTLFDGGSSGMRVSNPLVQLHDKTYLWGGIQVWQYDSIPEESHRENIRIIRNYSVEKDIIYKQWSNAVIID